MSRKGDYGPYGCLVPLAIWCGILCFILKIEDLWIQEIVSGAFILGTIVFILFNPFQKKEE